MAVDLSQMLMLLHQVRGSTPPSRIRLAVHTVSRTTDSSNRIAFMAKIGTRHFIVVFCHICRVWLDSGKSSQIIDLLRNRGAGSNSAAMFNILRHDCLIFPLEIVIQICNEFLPSSETEAVGNSSILVASSTERLPASLHFRICAQFLPSGSCCSGTGSF